MVFSFTDVPWTKVQRHFTLLTDFIWTNIRRLAERVAFQMLTSLKIPSTTEASAVVDCTTNDALHQQTLPK